MGAAAPARTPDSPLPCAPKAPKSPLSHGLQPRRHCRHRAEARAAAAGHLPSFPGQTPQAEEYRRLPSNQTRPFSLPQNLQSRDLHSARRGTRARRPRGAVPSSLEPLPTNLPLRKHLVHAQHLEHDLTQAKRAPNMALTRDLALLRDGDQRKKMTVGRRLWSTAGARNCQNRSREGWWCGVCEESN